MPLNKKPICTYVLMIVNIGVFLVELLQGATRNTVTLVNMGAADVMLITLGQWWRLITATFLHGNVQHLFSNILALWIWGRYAEGMFGKVRFVALYFLSGLAGSVFSYALSSSISVGASGAIFGLFGSFLYLRLRHKEVFDRVFGTQVIVLVVLNLLVGLFQPQIDLWGHVGGLVGGFFVAMVLGFLGEKGSVAWRAVGVVAYVAVLAGLILYGKGHYTSLLIQMGFL